MAVYSHLSVIRREKKNGIQKQSDGQSFINPVSPSCPTFPGSPLSMLKIGCSQQKKVYLSYSHSSATQEGSEMVPF